MTAKQMVLNPGVVSHVLVPDLDAVLGQGYILVLDEIVPCLLITVSQIARCLGAGIDQIPDPGIVPGPDTVPGPEAVPDPDAVPDPGIVPDPDITQNQSHVPDPGIAPNQNHAPNQNRVPDPDPGTEERIDQDLQVMTKWILHPIEIVIDPVQDLKSEENQILEGKNNPLHPQKIKVPVRKTPKVNLIDRLTQKK